MKLIEFQSGSYFSSLSYIDFLEVYYYSLAYVSFITMSFYRMMKVYVNGIISINYIKIKMIMD